MFIKRTYIYVHVCTRARVLKRSRVYFAKVVFIIIFISLFYYFSRRAVRTANIITRTRECNKKKKKVETQKIRTRARKRTIHA